MSDTVDQEMDTTRRDFLGLTSAVMGAVVLGTAGLGLVTTFRPSEETNKGQVVERSIADIEIGQQVEVKNLQGQLFYIRRRSADEIASAEGWSIAGMEEAGTGALGFKDVELDSERVQDPQFLVVEARCTHLGCAPVEQNMELVTANGGGGTDVEAGYFCPCHGSKYDISGRVRVGPAVLNLVVPPYAIEGEDGARRIIIGKAA